MSQSMYMMIATRKSLIDKYKIMSIKTGVGDITRFAKCYGSSELYEYFCELASDKGDQFRADYFDDDLDELYFEPCFAEDKNKKVLRNPYFISISILQDELQKLWQQKIIPSDDKDYDQYLEENRQLKIESINQLLGQIELFADSYEFIDIRLIFWIE